MALWYLHLAEEPGLLSLDADEFQRVITERFPDAEVLPGEDMSRVDIHLDSAVNRHTRVTWLGGIITMEASEEGAAVLACVVRTALPDEVTLIWSYEGGTPSTPVLPGDDPQRVLERSHAR